MRRGVSVWQSILISLLTASLVSVGFVLYIDSRNERTPADDIGVAPEPGLHARETVAMDTAIIQTTVSGDGTVVEQEGAFYLQASVAPADKAYQLISEPIAVRALIVGGPSGFDCLWRGLVDTDEGLKMQCEIPETVLVVAGLGGTMVVQMTEPISIQGLPRSAVVGRSQIGQVIVVNPDGTTETRSVDLGLSDSSYIEVLGGLGPSEKVYLYPIESDFSGGGN